MRALHTLLALVALAGAASPGFGDIVTTRGGAEHHGVVKLEVLRLSGADGDFEVPRPSIRELRATEGGFEVVLADGTTLVGVPDDPALSSKSGWSSARSRSQRSSSSGSTRCRRRRSFARR